RPPSDRWQSVGSPELAFEFDAPENMRGGYLFSPLGEPRDRRGKGVKAVAWQVHALKLVPPEYALSIGFWWLTPKEFGISEREISQLSESLGRSGAALEFLQRHFGGKESRFRGAEERNLVPTREGVGRRIGVFESAEYVVIPVRPRGVLVAAAWFDHGGRRERFHVWPRIVASIRMRDDAELEPAD
ncbi:MAG: hypothetical protein ACREKH_15940, partial [Candidatus Rokuibacteriota bacterium]